jgi:hypothetical protein
MGLRIGKIRGYEVKKNRDGSAEVLLLQVEVTDPDDIQTIEFYQAAGQDSNPPLDSLVAFLSVGNAWKIALGANDGIVPDSEPGEHKIYSSASGIIKAFLKLFKTGLAQLSATTIELNGNTDNAVRFSVLETEFNRLKSEFDNHSGHSGAGSTPTPSTADISGAKVDEVKLP